MIAIGFALAAIYFGGLALGVALGAAVGQEATAGIVVGLAASLATIGGGAATAGRPDANRLDRVWAFTSSSGSVAVSVAAVLLGASAVGVGLATGGLILGVVGLLLAAWTTGADVER